MEAASEVTLSVAPLMSAAYIDVSHKSSERSATTWASAIALYNHYEADSPKPATAADIVTYSASALEPEDTVPEQTHANAEASQEPTYL